MTVIKSGDLVVLKSGGPIMTVDTVNTDILDDNKITGVLCVWFVGEKLERVRFDHRALEPAQSSLPGKKDVCPEEATGEYKVVLDEMSAAMNLPAEAEKDGSKQVTKRPRRPSAAKYETLATSSSVGVVVS
ncbi:YodC family protein [Bradyrhizobium sp.]|uniref:YodC family protein n=1 Tax=Bradyrhizobium sp. TaxID=376 RepID=UPI003C712CA0